MKPKTEAGVNKNRGPGRAGLQTGLQTRSACVREEAQGQFGSPFALVTAAALESRAAVVRGYRLIRKNSAFPLVATVAV